MATNDEWQALVRRSGLRVTFCGYCTQVCLAGKRSLCCDDAVYDDEPIVAEFASRSGEQPPVPATPGNREGTGGNPFDGVVLDPRGPEIPLAPEVLRVIREDMP